VCSSCKEGAQKNDHQLTEWWRMWPEARLSAHDAGFPDKLMSLVAHELHCRTDVVVRALVHQAPVDWRQWRWAEHRCKRVWFVQHSVVINTEFSYTTVLYDQHRVPLHHSAVWSTQSTATPQCCMINKQHRYTTMLYDQHRAPLHHSAVWSTKSTATPQCCMINTEHRYTTVLYDQHRAPLHHSAVWSTKSTATPQCCMINTEHIYTTVL